MRSVDQLIVDLGERSYPIWIGADTTPEQEAAVAGRTAKGAVVIDGNLPPVDNWPGLERFIIPPEQTGETAKSMGMLGELYEFLAQHRIGRDGFLVAVGGGVTGDLGGFAAASYLRGIDFYQVPTTLLAMVDSSVGGKTGINIKAGKNLVGAFWQPKAVFISTDHLRTLPPWEFSAGMAEVIKYGMLYDRDLFDQLTGLDPLDSSHAALPGIIRRCCEIKAAIVKADEKETAASGGRALLNLGHTFAHAIENVAGYGTYLHGEAVGIGLAIAARLSKELTRTGRAGFQFPASEVQRADELLRRYYLPTDLRTPLPRSSRLPTPDSRLPTPDISPPELSVDDLLAAMMRDKKVKASKLRFVAMESLGTAVTVDDIEESLVRDLWLEAGAVG